MTKSILFTLVLALGLTVSNAQTPMQFTGLDCDGATVDLFADLDAGKAVVLFFYMPTCGSCPPPAQKIQVMANNINANYPGKVKGYAFPYQNSTLCSYSSTWVSSNSLGSIYQPMDSGSAMVAYYGGFGMPTVVLLGGSGANRRVMFSTLSFSSSDTTLMKDSIHSMLGTTGLLDKPETAESFSIYPNPATDLITIQLGLNEPTDLALEITDLMGKKVAFITKGRESGNVKKQFNVSGLPNGHYFVRLEINGKATTRKLTVNH